MAAGSDLPFSSFQPETRSSPTPTPHDPTPGLPARLTIFLSPASWVQGSGLPSCSSPPLCAASPALECVHVCLCERVCWRPCPAASLPPAGADPAALPSGCLARARSPLPLQDLSSCFFLYLPVFSPLSLCPSSDLDRDFWNNNESTVQQKWSSYPPKEFILNISPYAPYGDPRLSLK